MKEEVTANEMVEKTKEAGGEKKELWREAQNGVLHSS